MKRKNDHLWLQVFFVACRSFLRRLDESKTASSVKQEIVRELCVHSERGREKKERKKNKQE